MMNMIIYLKTILITTIKTTNNNNKDNNLNDCISQNDIYNNNKDNLNMNY